VLHTARHVAGLRGIAVEELAGATLENTERRFAKVFS
jgi:Tat protein secretion system quality control protein TatD with DNase activity